MYVTHFRCAGPAIWSVFGSGLAIYGRREEKTYFIWKQSEDVRYAFSTQENMRPRKAEPNLDASTFLKNRQHPFFLFLFDFPSHVNS